VAVWVATVIDILDLFLPKPLISFKRRGAGAVERGGLENRCPSCGGPRVRIPPSPPFLVNLINSISEIVPEKLGLTHKRTHDSVVDAGGLLWMIVDTA
jgi:hypothetical protein